MMFADGQAATPAVARLIARDPGSWPFEESEEAGNPWR